MKQSVEWLYETLWQQTDFSLPNNILEQAKEMEKQQIIDAYFEGIRYTLNERKDSIKADDTAAEDYYNETFKD